MAGTKDNDLVINRRIFEVRLLLLKGYKPMDIYQYVDNETDWNKSHSQINKYIAKARDMDKEDLIQDFDAKKKFMIDKLDYIYKQALSDKDYSNARGVLKQISDIEGLNAPQKLEGSLTIDKVLNGFMEKIKNEGE